MPNIVFVDAEVDPHNGTLLDLGAVKPDRSKCRTGVGAKFTQFISGARFICGHNILGHDINYIRDLISGDTADVSFPGTTGPSLVDTLCLSPLLFPRRPYHALLKDDKLQSEELNNPLSDAIKAMDLFFDEVNAFECLNGNLKSIYYALLHGQAQFSGFFQYMKSDEEGAGNLFRNPLAGNPPDPEKAEAMIRIEFNGRICSHAPLAEIINERPVELAYCLALISADDRYSMTPPWVYKSFPDIENVVRILRNDPCEEGCLYCDTQLDVHVRLKTVFGYEAFRAYDGEPLQEKAVQAAVKNRSLLVIFPTAGGKSLTFQLPALIAGEASRGLTIVISPLQSLMKDQVDNLSALGIADAVTINGLLSQIERAEAIARVESGLASILYISPESLRSKTIVKLLLSRNVVRFVIDEAHCFSSWGQDFRVDYFYIGDFIHELLQKKGPETAIPVSCFTATAKQKVISDIKDYFKQKLNIELEMFTTNAERSNLRYEVLYKKDDNDKYESMRNIIIRKDCSTIVYVSRVSRTAEIAARLVSDGFSALPYNGKMDSSDKIANQEAFLSGEAQIIVATTAFGMGVDKSDVGLVIHFDISDSLEGYVQEAGRAGRDPSLQADCYVLFHDDDLDKHFILLNQTKLSISEIQQVWRAIKDMTRYRNTLRRSPLEIARQAGWDEGVLDVETRVKTAVAALETAGYIKRGMNMPQIYATSISVKTMIEASSAIQASTKLNDTQKQAAARIISLLISSRSRAKAGQDDAESRVDYIADLLGLSMEQVIEAVGLMREEGILADSTDMSAIIQGDKEQNKSLTALRGFTLLERFLISYIGGENKEINLKEVNGAAEESDVKGSSVKAIKTILYFWIIRRYIKKTLSMADDHIEIEPEINAGDFLDRFQKRSDLAEFIVRYLFGKVTSGEVEADAFSKGILIPFSVLELKVAYDMDNRLFQSPGQTDISDVEDALLYLSTVRALTLEGGFLVLYNAMEIQRLELNNRIVYKEADYESLNEFYKLRIQQIHIVGEYANMMTRDYDEALGFVNDYFRMDYKEFIAKYFKEERAREIERNITPQKYEIVFGSLDRAQKEIINDTASKYIVTAAGPGSGKTRVLVHKLAALILLDDVKSEQLLMLTFSRAAATEFKRQLIELIGNAAHFVEIKTFHAYCFDLLGRIGSLEEADEVVKKAAKIIKAGDAETGRITKKVVVIDEAQDMSEDEFSLIKALMSKNDEMRVIAVGDDDQNIYEFRGSDSKYLKSLATDYGAKVYELLENYRSGRNIVALANNFAGTISNRLKSRPLLAHRQEDGIIEIVKYKSRNLEIPIVKQIKTVYKTESVCVLTKTNDEALVVTGLLLKEGIKAKLIQSNDGFDLCDLAEFRFFMENLSKESLSSVIGDSEWESALGKLRDAFSRSENLEYCLNLLEGFDVVNGRRYRSDLEQFIRESKLEDFHRFGRDEVVVSTIHKAKGREFDNVFMLLNEFYCDTDEKKRQLYVGLTRAKEALFIHYNGSCFDGFAAPGALRRLDPDTYPLPEVLAARLSHRDVNLGFFKNRSKAIEELRSGDNLVVTVNHKHHSEEQIATPGLSVETPRGPREILRFSKGFIQRIDELRRKGYAPNQGKIRFIVAWRDKDDGMESNIILPDVYFVRTKKEGEGYVNE